MERTGDELIRELARKVMSAEPALRACYQREATPANKQKLRDVLDALDACREASRN